MKGAAFVGLVTALLAVACGDDDECCVEDGLIGCVYVPCQPKTPKMAEALASGDD